ncbi:MAG: hypothetical protein ACI81V_000528 [Lentimonas sp.]|jgi:uncharacterized protein (DUF58 family)
MSDSSEELRRWQDWTDPEFFAGSADRERRMLPLLLRQFRSVWLPRLPRTRLTMTGWVLILVALGIGSAAYNTGSNILFLTLSLLLSSLVLSGILSQINFRKLEWSLRAPKHLRVDELGSARVELSNQKRVFPAMSLCFRVGDSDSDRMRSLYLERALSPGQQSSLDWTFRPQKRGRFQVKLSGVESQFPFGFLMKSLGTALQEEVLVWPKRVGYQFQPEQFGYRNQPGGAKRRVGAGSDLINLRPYERGDSPRLVHWKATARTGKLVVRQLAQEGVAGFHLYVDPAMELWSQPAFERLCSLAASVAEALFNTGRLERVQIAGEDPILVRDRGALHAVLDRLAVLERRAAAVNTGHVPSNCVTFKPYAAEGVAIYFGDQKAGHAHE